MRTRLQTRRIKRCNSARKIQEFWRYLCAPRCPITLDRISPGRGIKVLGHVYDAEALGRYISCSGDYRDPLSRKKIPVKKLKEIETRTGLGVLEFKDKIEADRNERIQRESVYSYFDNEIQTITGNIVDLLMDDGKASRRVMLECLVQLRRMRILTTNYLSACRDRAVQVHSEVVSTIMTSVTLHPIPQDVVLQVLDQHVAPDA